MRVKVKDEPTLERDIVSKAIINTDISAYNKYMIRKKLSEEKNQELVDLKNEVNELKELVQNLLGK